jgi:predicted nucleic acid-binding protein
VFLDANVLFSAAYRAGSGLSRLWSVEGIRLVTSAYAAAEARRNLARPEQRQRLDALLAPIEQIGEDASRRLPDGIELPEKDVPILSAAIAAGATHLLTGDVMHFGRYFGRTVSGVLILPPGDFLRESHEPTSPP